MSVVFQGRNFPTSMIGSWYFAKFTYSAVDSGDEYCQIGHMIEENIVEQLYEVSWRERKGLGKPPYQLEPYVES
jgi:hypothetical protein